LNHTCTLFVVSVYFCKYNRRVDLQAAHNLNDMKLSKLTYHNGAIKIEVYQKGQDRKRWNTGVRVDKKLLTKDKFIKPTPLIDWQTLNIKISEEKERVDRVVREVFGESDELDHLNPEQIDQGIRSKLTTHFRTKLTTLIRAN
jgi:wobble nucleotide-excising tRNase